MAKLRVLAVDDSRNTLLVIERLLRHFDCEVRACQDSKNAIRTVLEFQPHVIFLDIDMPLPDGFEVAEDLDELELPDYMLVALTAFTDEAHRRECEASGFDVFLAKPVSIEDIDKVVESAKQRFHVESCPPASKSY